ncbi:flavodoxin family protein [uncultured Ruminococcus sp.]|uniref:flavodoxin family protein n=1 Tax=uncultured Ruminococcus sp. TaxID=165186 RepID=UPI0025DA3D8A|nr:flavodoxin family protein [uncultured Ruminococcus sp.]
MKTAIVYYSMNGNTEYAVKKIAEQTDAELIPIRPVKAYPDKGFKKFFWGGKSAVMGEKPELEGYSFDAKKYDVIVFATPVWASNFTPPIRTFIEDNRGVLKGKKFAAVICFSGGGADKAIIKLKDFLGTDSFAAELILIDPKDKPDSANESKLADFCKKLNEL